VRDAATKVEAQNKRLSDVVVAQEERIGELESVLASVASAKHSRENLNTRSRGTGILPFLFFFLSFCFVLLSHSLETLQLDSEAIEEDSDDVAGALSDSHQKIYQASLSASGGLMQAAVLSVGTINSHFSKALAVVNSNNIAVNNTSDLAVRSLVDDDSDEIGETFKRRPVVSRSVFK
jgi:hypothetical protein